MKQQIYHFLPKIDCGRCGYADCSSYADAVFQGACIHLCEAGGNEVMQDLARITSRPTHKVNIIPKQQAAGIDSTSLPKVNDVTWLPNLTLLAQFFAFQITLVRPEHL